MQLRKGSSASAADWEQVLVPIIERYRGDNFEKYFRGDAAFAEPGLYVTLEQEDFYYAIRIKENARLIKAIDHLLTRPVGRPPKKPIVVYYSFNYQAESWEHARRIVAKIEWHMDELFPRIGFIVTNLNWSAKRVTRFYNQRGTCEQYIKEGKYALNWTRLSCRDFRANEVRLLLFGLAYNLGNFMRTLALPKSIKTWSMTTLKNKLIKLGARIVKHARYTHFQLAEISISSKLFQKLLERVNQLALDTG